MKKVIFSVLLGGYDPVPPAPVYPGWDTILFTDQMPEDTLGWQIRLVDPTDQPHKESRRYKILSHIYLPEYELACYMDANMKLLKEPPSNPIHFSHPRRSNLRQEAARVIELEKAPELAVRDQLSEYFRQGFNDQVGLFENRFFIRYLQGSLNKLYEEWWAQVDQFTHRDQLSLPFAVWKLGLAPRNVKPSNRRFFTILDHHMGRNPANSEEQYQSTVHVHHMTPGRGDKNIGLAINRLVAHLPDEDWICIRDIDTQPPNHKVFYRQCEQIAASGSADLIGCMVGRLGLDYQLLDGKMSDNTNFEVEIQRALKEYRKFGNEVKLIDQTIAGVFMLFSKKTWQAAGGFQEGGIIFEGGRYFDKIFCEAVLAAGLKIGIAPGLYLFHAYRMGAANVRTATEHLI